MTNFFSFVGGNHGRWRVTGSTAIVGEDLPAVAALEMINLPPSALADRGTWVLHGFTSNVRYAERSEIAQLKAIQPGLNRPEATCAALIMIHKNPAWWALAQDERRAIFETQAQHTAIGLRYLPAIARQLHHCRDLNEPFDFLTWFEFAPEHATAFDELLTLLRASAEWAYVEREVEIRLERQP